MNNSRNAETRTDLISVIVPVFEVEAYLAKCLDSIRAQTYENLEIIVVDDGSTDQSGQIAEEYAALDKRFRVYHKDNGGLSDARNFGIKKASGEYLTFIDSDDFVDPDCLEYLYDTLMLFSTRISICQHRVIFPSGEVKDYGQYGSLLISAKDCIERILYDDILNTSAWAKLYSKSLFSSVEFPKGMLYEDIGTIYKLLFLAEKIAVGYESKYNYILRKNSIVTGKFNSKKMDLLMMTDQMASDVLSVYPELEKAVHRRQVYARFSTLNQMSDAEGFETERSEIITFIKKHRKEILCNPKVPRRDKLAVILLSIDCCLYRSVWNIYLKRRNLL